MKLSVRTGLDVLVSRRAGRPFLGGHASSDLSPALTAQQAKKETWRRRHPEARLAGGQGGLFRTPVSLPCMNLAAFSGPLW